MARLIRHSLSFFLTLALILTLAGVLTGKLRQPVSWERTAQNELTVHLRSQTVRIDLDRLDRILQRCAEIGQRIQSHTPGWVKNAWTSVKNAFSSFCISLFGAVPDLGEIIPQYKCKNADLAAFTNGSTYAIMNA